jgi:hypothetical protein
MTLESVDYGHNDHLKLGLALSHTVVFEFIQSWGFAYNRRS